MVILPRSKFNAKDLFIRIDYMNISYRVVEGGRGGTPNSSCVIARGPLETGILSISGARIFPRITSRLHRKTMTNK